MNSCSSLLNRAEFSYTQYYHNIIFNQNKSSFITFFLNIYFNYIFSCIKYSVYIDFYFTFSYFKVKFANT